MSADDRLRPAPGAADDPSMTVVRQALTEIGRREGASLTSETMARIAQAAARERSLTGTGVGPPTPTVDTTTDADIDIDLGLDVDGDADGKVATLRPGGDPSPWRRWSVLAAAATVLVAVGAAAVLSGSDKVVVTDQAAEVVVDDAAGDRAEQGDRAVLDLGTPSTMPSSDPPAAPAEPATSDVPGDGPSASTDADPVGSDEPALVTPTSTSATSTPGDGEPASTIGRPAEGFDLTVGRAGSVNLRFVAGLPEIAEVVEEPGWTHTVVGPAVGSIQVRFTSGPDEAMIDVWNDADGFHIAVDPGPLPPGFGQQQMKTIALGSAGTVDVGWGPLGLISLDVRVAEGWRVDPVATATDRLDLRVVGPAEGRSTVELRGVPSLIVITTVDETAIDGS